MGEIDVLNDMNVVTTIPRTTLESLNSKLIQIILHGVFESVASGKLNSIINLSFGRLVIDWSEDELKFNFIPSNRFKSDINKTIKTKSSPLTQSVEDALVNKIINAYKDLF